MGVKLIECINIFFLYYILFYAITFFIHTLMGAISLDRIVKRNKYIKFMNITHKENYIPVSFLVPAYNEELTVVETVSSLLALEYEEYEIVVINDGSSDETRERIIEAFSLHPITRPVRRVVQCNDIVEIYEGGQGIKITLVDKMNGGKADALNAGINVCQYPYFVSMDADSVLQKDTLTKLVQPVLQDETVVAVGGSIKVSNQAIIERGIVKEVFTPRKGIVLFQMIEYMRVFLTSRVMLNAFNGNLIISGALGLFNKYAVIQAGGYDTKTVGEDMEIIVKLHSYHRKHKLKYKIAYAPDALCWTQVPETYNGLKKQRRRWHKGLMQSMRTHFYVFLNPRYGIVGGFAFLYYLIYELSSPIVEVLGLGVIIFAYFMDLLDLKFFIIYMIIYFGYSVVVSVAAIFLESYIYPEITSRKTIAKLILFAFLECLGYRQLSSFYRLTSFLSSKGKRYEWEKADRITHHSDSDMSA